MGDQVDERDGTPVGRIQTACSSDSPVPVMIGVYRFEPEWWKRGCSSPTNGTKSVGSPAPPENSTEGPFSPD